MPALLTETLAQGTRMELLTTQLCEQALVYILRTHTRLLLQIKNRLRGASLEHSEASHKATVGNVLNEQNETKHEPVYKLRGDA